MSKVPRAVTPASDQRSLTEESSSPFSPVVLHDGTVVDLEPMHPGDEARLDRFHHTLSRETTQRRFFAVHPQLSDQELHWFTHVDHRHREAMVAVHDNEIVGVGRLDRLDNGDEDAEVAFVVADAWQGRGLGSALFARLAQRARELGVRRFVADTFFDNRRMLAVFRHSKLARTETIDGNVIHLTLVLGDDPASSIPGG